MSLDANDLIRIGKLIKLAADTARVFSDEQAVDGETSRIVDAVDRINSAADDLMSAGKTLVECSDRRKTGSDKNFDA